MTGYFLIKSVVKLFCGICFLLIFLQISLSSIPPNMENIFHIKNLKEPATLDSKVAGSWCAVFDDFTHDQLYRRLKTNSFNLKKCKKIIVPGFDIVFNDISKKTKTVWLYKSFFIDSIPKGTSNQFSIRLGAISDIDVAYLNGRKIGQTGNFKSDLPQNYDKIRIYTFDRHYLKNKGIPNYLLVKVKPYFRGNQALGILQDTVKIGSTQLILANFYFSQFFKLLMLTVYLSVAFYFLFLFFRRRNNFDDLYFALFTICISSYTFLRTQIKYEFGWDFIITKKVEYFLLIAMPFLCFHFIRKFCNFKYKSYYWFLDITSVCLGLYFILSSNLLLFNLINYKYNVWLLSFYIILILRFLIIKSKEKSLDALLVLGSTCILIFGVVIDRLITREIIVFPRIVGYLFSFYVLSLATILANKFIRLNEEVEDLNTSLEKKVKERTIKLKKTLMEMTILKDQQDGDYFLTSLLIRPLIKNESKSKYFIVEFYTKQKKEFLFKGKKYEIGGDISIADNLRLQDKNYIVFANADAMGKSIQGAGGAIVLGVVFHAFLSRYKTNTQNSKTPELWMKEVFLEMQNIFETFDCSMLISIFLGLIDETTGFMYFINAEHPWGVIYRDKKAKFIGSESYIRKIGIPKNENHLLIKTYQLKPNDVILIGSDGRDDIRINMEGSMSFINHDETLFLKEVEKADGNLKKLVTSLQNTGELTDDLTLLKVIYNQHEKSNIDYQKIHKIYKKAGKLYRQKRFNECIECCNTNLKLNKESACIVRLLSYAYFRSGNLSKSANSLKDYLYYFPSAEKDIYKASLIAHEIKHYQDAIDYAEQVYLRNPKFMQNTINLVQLYKIVGIKNRMGEMLEKSEQLFPDHPNVSKLRTAILGEDLASVK